MQVVASKASLTGSITVPGSKSHTIRACLFAGLAHGTSHIYNPVASEDCLSAVKMIRNFGCSVDMRNNEWIVKGIGSKWPQPSFVIDVGNSGTLLSFSAGIAATLHGYSVITGDASICKRPLEDELQGFRQLGAKAFATRKGIDAPPVIIEGPIRSGLVRLKGTLSQHVSGTLMAAALTEGITRIELSDPGEIPFVKMTVGWLESLGVHVEYDHENYVWYEITGPNTFLPFDKTIPSDWESVAFPVVAGILTHSEIVIDNIDMSSTQGDKAIIDLLNEMGAHIETDTANARLIVHPTNELHGITASLSDFPDALPVLSIAAAFAHGRSQFTNIGVCRLKETDRITLMRKELSKLGVICTEGTDYLEVNGMGGQGIHGGGIESYDDHRIAMAFAVCGLALPPEYAIVINNAECCSVSFPHFYESMNGIGAGYKIK